MPAVANTFNGFYRGLVIESRDPKMRGRVKVRIPDLLTIPDVPKVGEWCKAGLWALPANNYLGGRNQKDTSERCNFPEAHFQGSCLIPPKGSYVFIFFEKGNPNFPYYMGAADIGAVKVLPENQYGSSPEQKWTLLKTNKGRCIVVSDDEDDCRVEITGKKRQLNSPPNGDMKSIFDIDGNQSVILIDERKGKEKIYIKDYKGNFIRIDQEKNDIVMFAHHNIQMKAENDIYIEAGRDIQIQASRDIKSTAKNDMSLYAMNKFSETAKSMDRMSLSYDKRSAMTDIADAALMNMSRHAGVDLSDSAINLGRNGITISDDAKASMSIKGAVSTVVKGGSIAVDGICTAIQPGGAPSGIKQLVLQAAAVAPATHIPCMGWAKKRELECSKTGCTAGLLKGCKGKVASDPVINGGATSSCGGGGNSTQCPGRSNPSSSPTSSNPSSPACSGSGAISSCAASACSGSTSCNSVLSNI